MATWLVDKLWVRQMIQSELGVSKDQVLFVDHHLSHAASSFLVSPFDEAATLTVDGVGEWATATFGTGRGSDIQLHKEMRFPHSVGLLYSAFTAFLGFEVNEGEYKVMGMAAYGEGRYVDDVWKLVRQHEDGSIELDMDYFSFHYSTTRMYSRKFESRFGCSRQPGMPFGSASEDQDGCLTLSDEDMRYADIAASIQTVFEEILIKMTTQLRADVGASSLCLAGGVALNSVANSRILKESGFDRLYIQPAAGDSGGALGAAYHVYHGLLGNKRCFEMNHVSYGEGYSDSDVAQALGQAEMTFTTCANDDALIAETSRLLESGEVVGWFQGRFEWGPRSLGSRSILADPRQSEMRDRVNAKVKFREPFRPFAPSILESRTAEMFDSDPAVDQEPGRFMLLVADVSEDSRVKIPAATHVDGTARFQAVSSDTTPLFHSLIDSFGQVTGTPALLNTSFNVRGEPIVASPQDAIHTFCRSGLDTLVIGHHVVRKG
jgi:carbamoyltransferase